MQSQVHDGWVFTRAGSSPAVLDNRDENVCYRYLLIRGAFYNWVPIANLSFSISFVIPSFTAFLHVCLNVLN